MTPVNPINPLSPFTYYRRHKGQALLLVGLIAALTLGVYTMVSLTDVVFETIRHTFHYLTRMSRLFPSTGPDIGWGWASEVSISGMPDAGFAAQIRAQPDVAAVIPENGLYVGVPLGMVVPIPVLGVTEADLPVVMEACDLRLKRGRLLRPRTGEIVLSEEIVRALDLTIGDPVSYEINKDYYPTIATELTLVGILESVPSAAGPEVRTGFVSYEYLESHELYQPRAMNWLILPHPGHRIAVNDFTSDLIDESAGSSSVLLHSFEDEMIDLQRMQRVIDTLYGFVDGLVVVAAALVVGMVHRIAIAHRLPEIGLLHAAGYHKRRLVRRLVFEIAVVACVGWTIGLLCAHGFLILLSSIFFSAQGWSTNLADPTPLLYTLPIPLVVVAWVNVSVRRTLSHLDPVAIIERGKLSMEKTLGKKQRKVHSLPRPLSSWTFYLRHRSRSALRLAAIGLMVLGVALPGFINVAQWDSMLPLYLCHGNTANVSPGFMYRDIPADIVAQVRAHPSVAHAIHVKALVMAVNLPMVGEMAAMPIYAVREQDLPILLDTYGLRLREGDMVQSRSGQIVLTDALARNRNLGVGSTIGYPVHEIDGMPTELTVVGLLESTRAALVERAGYDIPSLPRWAGFVSHEFVDSHERYAGTPNHVLVVPVEGREAEMEAWLEETVASPRVNVETLGTVYRSWRITTQTGHIVFGISLTVLAAVAGLGLAILNVISFAQRRDEIGILYATGHNRAKLVARALRENVSIMVLAWLTGAAICIAGMFYAQATLYAPLGTSVDWTNLTPWLFTLPLPVAVVAASAGTTAWTLSRLDPVAVIERR